MSISIDEIEQQVAAGINNSQVTAQGQDGKYQVQVVSDFFAGLNAVKRQQAVYKILNPHLASGVIHAVSMHLFTNEEFSKKSAES